MAETLQSLFWKLQVVDGDNPPDELGAEVRIALGLSFLSGFESIDEALENLERALGPVPEKWDFQFGWGWRCDAEQHRVNMMLDWRERRYGKADWFEPVEATASSPVLAIYACICGAKAQLEVGAPISLGRGDTGGTN